MSQFMHKKGSAVDRQKMPLFKLQVYHFRAVELRYEGKTYHEIMGEIAVQYRKGVQSDTIRKWFGRGGLLEVEYMAYARVENDRRRQMMREELKKLAGKIPIKLEKMLDRIDGTGQPDMVTLAAVRTLIEVLGITGNEGGGSGG